jgi:hypothetical protein
MVVVFVVSVFCVAHESLYTEHKMLVITIHLTVSVPAQTAVPPRHVSLYHCARAHAIHNFAMHTYHRVVAPGRPFLLLWSVY